jgi:hypothetical protein
VLRAPATITYVAKKDFLASRDYLLMFGLFDANRFEWFLIPGTLGNGRSNRLGAATVGQACRVRPNGVCPLEIHPSSTHIRSRR